MGTTGRFRFQPHPKLLVWQAVYPFALSMLLRGGDGSPLLRRTLANLTSDPCTGEADFHRIRDLVSQLSQLSGRSRQHVLMDIARTAGGRRLAVQLLRVQLLRLCSRVAVMASALLARVRQSRRVS